MSKPLFLLFVAIALALPAKLPAQVTLDEAQAETPDMDDIYQRAQRGDIHAQFQLFKIYRRGVGAIEADHTKAIRWLISSGNSGHTEAQYWLGYIYFFGSGVPRDVEKGMAWFKQSANHGFVHAQATLGMIYNGLRYRFYPSDHQLALAWYTKAAQQGHLQPIFIIGCSQYFGINQITDKPAGLAWFKKAASLGDDTAMVYLESNNDEELGRFCKRVARL